MEISFIVKKVISAILLPLPLVILCLIFGLALLWFTRLQLAGKLVTTLGFSLLLLSALPFLPDYMLKNLEARYSPLLQPPPVNYVVVLGGGFHFDKRAPADSQIKGSSLSRLAEGIRLYRAIPGAKLLLSGGAVYGMGSEAIAMQRAAIDLGVPAQDIIVESIAKDTHEQAAKLQPTLGDQAFILVTSAYHMPRAMLLFEKFQMHPIAGPTEYYLKLGDGEAGAKMLISSKNVDKLDLAIHEYLGIWWAQLSS